VLAALGASRGTARDPSGVSPASSVVFVVRKYRVVEADAFPPPWFFVVSVIETVPPAAAAVLPLTAEMTRSGPIFTAVAMTLLVSTVSAFAFVESACERMKNEPVPMSAGSVTVVEPALVAPAARAATPLDPSGASPASSALFVDR
jgi:hypothetical protein